MPLIHLNGTGIETLQEGYAEAADRLRDFIKRWGRIEFNARDYYPNGPDAWPKAIEAREAISAKIAEIEDYIDLHREHLYNSK